MMKEINNNKKNKGKTAKGDEKFPDNRSTKEISKLKKKLTDSENSNKELMDKYLRLSAEFDNYKKRTLKEKIELAKTGGEQIILNILPVIDDFDRAMQIIDKAIDLNSVKEGITLIYNKFSEFLNQNGIKEIETSTKEFNLDYHEAITKIPSPSEELKGKIVDVIQKGYLLNDKVIRYAKVVVGD